MSTQSPHVEQLVQQGIAAAKTGRHGVAQQSLREAVRLAPDHEQAWLWLSGVEDNEQAKLAALHEVLRINPNNGSAHKGIEHLTQPKMVDLATLLPPAPPPAQAAWSPPPAKAAPPTPASGPLPTFTPASATATTPQFAGSETTFAPVMEQEVAPDVLANLRPAIEKAKKKRPFWPRVSELVISFCLLLGIIGAFLLVRQRLQGQFAELRGPAAQTRRVATPASGDQALAPLVEPTLAPVAPPLSSQVNASRSYNLRVMSATPNSDTGSVVLNVELANPGKRPVGFRSRDFHVFNNASGRLTFQAAESSLFAGKNDAALSIPAGESVSGTMTFTGDVSRLPLTLVWQPFNGGVTQNIVVR